MIQDKKGAPVAYLTATKPYDTLQFQCFYCKKLMAKEAVINNETQQINLELKCPDHEAVQIVFI